MQETNLSLEHHWMPFTDNRDFKAAPKLAHGADGIWLIGAHRRKILDGSSGLFTTPAGHGRKSIADAVRRQLIELDYISIFRRGYESSFRLASRLAAMLPDPLNRIFFVNSGSESVDTAMKICLAYHTARRDGNRKMFVSRERAYHGMNFGDLSLAGMVRNRIGFGTGLPGIVHMRHPWLPGNRFVIGEPATGAELADDLQRMVDTYGADSIAACIVEPIAGSTGVLVPPRGYLRKLREICDRHGILLVFDEVITGFGRTGKPFASQTFEVTPDLLTMAKPLTNGTQPMGAVAVARHVYDTIVEATPEGAIEFMHGYTFSAHPAACAAALATLAIYEEERLFERAAHISTYFLDRVATLRDLPVVSDIRGYGMLAGIDVMMLDRPGLRGNYIQKRPFDAGLYVKVTGDSIILAPPFIIDGGEIDRMCSILREVLGAQERSGAGAMS